MDYPSCCSMLDDTIHRRQDASSQCYRASSKEPSLDSRMMIALPKCADFGSTTSNHISLSSRDLTTDNTINIIYGVLAFVLGVLSVAFAWATWLLQKRAFCRRGQITADHGSEDDLELQRIARDHHGNYVTL